MEFEELIEFDAGIELEFAMGLFELGSVGWAVPLIIFNPMMLELISKMLNKQR
jgi:hypothetical protein